mmetsp:Transcript_4107/g.14711  ORF Transcript_4107/g.14711 Transcript_4107/m.14711 type:complete len:219 (-) Transcript_4107:175-831(-)
MHAANGRPRRGRLAQPGPRAGRSDATNGGIHAEFAEFGWHAAHGVGRPAGGAAFGERAAGARAAAPAQLFRARDRLAQRARSGIGGGAMAILCELLPLHELRDRRHRGRRRRQQPRLQPRLLADYPNAPEPHRERAAATRLREGRQLAGPQAHGGDRHHAFADENHCRHYGQDGGHVLPGLAHLRLRSGSARPFPFREAMGSSLAHGRRRFTFPLPAG